MQIGSILFAGKSRDTLINAKKNAKVTSMSLIVASFAMIDASSCGDISRELPVDSLPTWSMRETINDIANTCEAIKYKEKETQVS